MLKNAIFLACLLGVAFATPQQLRLGQESSMAVRQLATEFDTLTPRQKIESVNDMADVIMTEIRMLLSELGFDPFKLPDVHKGFKIMFIHGELDMERGWAQDISEIYRNGDVKIDYTNRILTLEVPFKFPQILFNYDYNAKFMNLGPDGTIDGGAKEIQISYTLTLNFEDLVVTLDKFEISKIGKISVKFHGNGIVDWFVNFLTPIVTGIFKGVITNIAELIVRNTLVDIIDILNNELANLKPAPIDIDQMQNDILKSWH